DSLRMTVVRCPLLVSRSSLLVAGCWLFAAGESLFVAGCFLPLSMRPAPPSVSSRASASDRRETSASRGILGLERAAETWSGTQPFAATNNEQLPRGKHGTPHRHRPADIVRLFRSTNLSHAEILPAVFRQARGPAAGARPGAARRLHRGRQAAAVAGGRHPAHPGQ